MERRVDHTIHDILETNERVQRKILGRIFAEFDNDWESRFIVQRARCQPQSREMKRG